MEFLTETRLKCLDWETRVSKSPEVSRQAEEDGCLKKECLKKEFIHERLPEMWWIRQDCLVSDVCFSSF